MVRPACSLFVLLQLCVVLTTASSSSADATQNDTSSVNASSGFLSTATPTPSPSGTLRRSSTRSGFGSVSPTVASTSVTVSHTTTSSLAVSSSTSPSGALTRTNDSPSSTTSATRTMTTSEPQTRSKSVGPSTSETPSRSASQSFGDATFSLSRTPSASRTVVASMTITGPSATSTVMILTRTATASSVASVTMTVTLSRSPLSPTLTRVNTPSCSVAPSASNTVVSSMSATASSPMTQTSSLMPSVTVSAIRTSTHSGTSSATSTGTLIASFSLSASRSAPSTATASTPLTMTMSAVQTATVSAVQTLTSTVPLSASTSTSFTQLPSPSRTTSGSVSRTGSDVVTVSATAPTLSVSLTVPPSVSVTLERTVTLSQSMGTLSRTSRRSVTVTGAASATATVLPTRSETASRTRDLPVHHRGGGASKTTQTIGTTTSVAVATTGAVVGSVGGGALALQQVAALAAFCIPYDPDEEYPVMEHPLRFAVGTGPARHPLGAAVGQMILLIFVCTVVLVVVLGRTIFVRRRDHARANSEDNGGVEMIALSIPILDGDKLTTTDSKGSNSVISCHGSSVGIDSAKTSPTLYETFLQQVVKAHAVTMIAAAFTVFAPMALMPAVAAVVQADAQVIDERTSLPVVFDDPPWIARAIGGSIAAFLFVTPISVMLAVGVRISGHVKYEASATVAPLSSEDQVSVRSLRKRLWAWLWTSRGQWSATHPSASRGGDTVPVGVSTPQPPMEPWCRYRVYRSLFNGYRWPWHWFLVAELYSALSLAALAAVSSASIDGACFKAEIAAVASSGLLFVMTFALRPHLFHADFFLAMTASTLETLAASMLAAGANPTAVIGVLLVLACLAIVQIAAKLVRRVQRIFTKVVVPVGRAMGNAVMKTAGFADAASSSSSSGSDGVIDMDFQSPPPPPVFEVGLDLDDPLRLTFVMTPPPPDHSAAVQFSFCSVPQQSSSVPRSRSSSLVNPSLRSSLPGRRRNDSPLAVARSATDSLEMHRRSPHSAPQESETASFVKRLRSPTMVQFSFCDVPSLPRPLEPHVALDVMEDTVGTSTIISPERLTETIGRSSVQFSFCGLTNPTTASIASADNPSVAVPFEGVAVDIPIEGAPSFVGGSFIGGSFVDNLVSPVNRSSVQFSFCGASAGGSDGSAVAAPSAAVIAMEMLSTPSHHGADDDGDEEEHHHHGRTESDEVGEVMRFSFFSASVVGDSRVIRATSATPLSEEDVHRRMDQVARPDTVEYKQRFEDLRKMLTTTL